MTGSVNLREHRWVIWFGAAVLVALVIVLAPMAFGEPILNSGDINVYQAEMELLFDGQVPYTDFQFEHLPLAIVPMAVAQLISVLTSVRFVYPFLVISIAMLATTAWLVARIGERLDLGSAPVRFVVIASPMLLLIPFRIDALSVLLTTAAVWWAIDRREGWSAAAAIGGILAKGWPVVLAATDWWRGERRRARWLVLFTAGMGLFLYALPGFRAARSFVGVHQETLSGSLVIVARLVFGQDAQLVHSAGAEYVAVGGWAVLINLAAGATIGVAALTVLRRGFSWKGGVALTGALTYAVLLGSPLLSAQFLLWPMPFVALVGTRREQVILTGAAALSVALVAFWYPGELWWHTAWLARNIALVAAAVLAVRTARTVAARAEPQLAAAA